MKHNLLSGARNTAGFLLFVGCAIVNSQAQTEIPEMVSHFPLDETGTEVIAAVMEAKDPVFFKNRRAARNVEKLAFYTPGPGQKISLENNGFNSIEIADIHGKVLRVLPVSPEIFWDGSDRTGAMAESGVYVVRLPGKGRSQHQRFVLAR